MRQIKPAQLAVGRTIILLYLGLPTYFIVKLRSIAFLFTFAAVSRTGVIKQHEVDTVKRQKRDVFDADELLNAERHRRDTMDRRFDPFRFGSSDRFSHGFGKRHTSNNAATASVALLFSLTLIINPLKRSGIRWLHLEVFSVIQV